MAIELNERIGKESAAILTAMNGRLAGVWTALPGIVQAFDPERVTAEVQIAILGEIQRPDGTTEQVNLPLLVDCPVVFPRGGGCTLTFPVRAGDECLVVFASRCIDAWWQQGGTQPAMEPRMHDLSDGFVLVGPQSQPAKIGAISTSAVQLRSDDGTALIEIDPASHRIRAQTSGDIEATAAGAMRLTAPTITLTGAVTIDGPLVQGKGAQGGAASMAGPLTVTNDVTAGGKSLKTHVHGGVQPGGSNTGQPS